VSQYIPIPPNKEDPAAYAFGELQDLARALAEDKETVPFQILNAAPAKPREGMIAHADGTNWNPGDGAGPYSYIGGAWTALFTGGGGGLSDGDKGDITVGSSGATLTIDNDAVTFTKFQNITDERLLGRSAGSSGDMQELTVGVGLTLASGNLYGSQLETRTSDPGTPFTGQMWLRTDL
jgi:hypothetical protein